eukprot:823081-Rhodomonas_salina.1
MPSDDEQAHGSAVLGPPSAGIGAVSHVEPVPTGERVRKRQKRQVEPDKASADDAWLVASAGCSAGLSVAPENLPSPACAEHPALLFVRGPDATKTFQILPGL